MAAADRTRRFRLAGWTVDPASGEVRRGATLERLEPRVMDVLFELARSGEDVVSKQDLLEAVWDGAYVSDDVIWRCIAAIRRALEDNAQKPRVLETLRGRGYRLLAPVEWLGSDPRSVERPAKEAPNLPATSTASLPPNPLRSRPSWRAGIPFVVLIAIAGWIAAANADRQRKAASEPATPASPSQITRLASQAWDDYHRYGRLDLERAAVLFARIVELEPRSAEGHIGLANTYAQLAIRHLERDHAARSLREAREAVRLAPQAARTHKALGLALLANGDQLAAIDAYHRAIELRPDAVGAIQNLAELYRIRGQLDRSLYWHRRYLEKRGAGPMVLTGLADIMHRLGDPALARQYLERALELEPLHSRATISLAWLEVLEGRPELGLEHVEELVRADPAARTARLAAAEISFVLGHPANARAHLKAIAEASGDSILEAEILELHIVGQPVSAERRRDLLARAEVVPNPATRGVLQAKIELLGGSVDRAVDALDRAIDAGYLDHARMAVDPILSRLSSNERFQRLLAEVEARQEGLARIVQAAAPAARRDKST